MQKALRRHPWLDFRHEFSFCWWPQRHSLGQSIPSFPIYVIDDITSTAVDSGSGQTDRHQTWLKIKLSFILIIFGNRPNPRNCSLEFKCTCCSACAFYKFLPDSCYSSCWKKHRHSATMEVKRPKTWAHLIKGSCDLIYVNYAAIVAVNRKQSGPAIIFQYYSPISASHSLVLANKPLPATMYNV